MVSQTDPIPVTESHEVSGAFPNREKLRRDARDLIGWDDGPPEKENAAPAGNRDGGKQDAIGDNEVSSKKRAARQARIEEILGFSLPSDSPLDVVVKMTEFRDVYGYEAEPLALSMRDLDDEIEHWTAREKAGLPLIVGGEFGDERSSKGSLRHAANRENVTAIVVDYDDERIPFVEAKRRVKEAGVACFLYTSPSHSPEAPRWRAVFPVSEPLPTWELARLTDRANGLFEGALAGESWSPVQPFYAGQVRGRPPMKRALVDGRFLDLADDLPGVPSKHGSTTRHRDKAEDPREKRGVVGAWCRVYDAVDVIEDQLSDVYAPAGRGRYRFKAGSSKVGGVAIYDKRSFAHSNHDSDPARGLNNSFDLMMKHRFGHLDEGLAPDTPMTDRPSYRAMCEHARRDPAVAAELAREESDLIDEFDDVSEPEERSSGLVFTPADDCASVSQRDYVIKGLLARGDVAAIHGHPGVGKSLLAPFMGYAVAQGELFFGRRTKAGGVLYVAAEDPAGMQGRVAALRSELGGGANFTLVSGVGSLLPGSPQLAALKREVRRRQPMIVFIDTLALAFGGIDENSSQDMAKVIAASRGLADLGPAVCLIHHSPKTGDGSPRGHSSLNGMLDLSLELVKGDDGIVRAIARKNRNGSCDNLDITFRIAVSTMGEDEDGDAITFARCRPLDGPAPKAGPKPSPAEKAALSLLRAMCDRRGDVDEREWRAACRGDPQVSSSESAEVRRVTTHKAIQGLIRKGLIDLFAGRARPVSPGDRVAVDDFDDERTVPRHRRLREAAAALL